jgi:hypothetical protein
MAGDGGRAPDVSEQRAELEVLRDLRERVLGFGGDDYTLVPWIDRHKLHVDRGRPYIGCPFCRDRFVCLDDPASVLAALLAEQPDATIAALETLLTSDEALTEMEYVWAKLGNRDGLFGSVGLLDAASKRRLMAAACRSLRPKAPKEDRDA